MIVLKVGGSVFGRDTTSAEVDDDSLMRLAAEVRPLVGRLVVVHGAGRFPRTLLPPGLVDNVIPAADEAAVAALRLALEEVSARVTGAWSGEGLPVTTTSTSSPEELRGLLTAGRLPLLRGDVSAAAEGFRIDSSDRVTERVALALGALRVVWASDVDGVLDPGGRPLKLLTSVSRRELEKWFDPWREPSPPGTGEMRGKIEAALRLAAEGIPSTVVNGRVAGRVEAALAGREVMGTVVPAPREGDA